MRRVLVGGLVILLLAMAVYCVISRLSGAISDTEFVAPGAAETTRPDNAPVSHVAFVHDGVTLYLQPGGTTSRGDEITVRLIGIDTPELRPSVECFVIEARGHLR